MSHCYWPISSFHSFIQAEIADGITVSDNVCSRPSDELTQPTTTAVEPNDMQMQSLPAKRARTMNVRLADYETAAFPARSAYVCMPTSAASASFSTPASESASTSDCSDESEIDERSEALKLYFDLLDNFSSELEKRFGTLQSDIAAAVAATNPMSDTFMDKTIMQPLANLASLKFDDAELDLAKRFFGTRKALYCDAKAIAQSAVIETMPSVRNIIELSRTIAVSTAVCESSFSCLKRVLTPHRLSMLHKRKADLILISFERLFARKLQTSGELVRRFWDSGPNGRRRLPLF